MIRRLRFGISCLALAAIAAAPAQAPLTIVLCAPGYPGTTKQAEVTMEIFAAAAAHAAGWSEADLSAVYFEAEQGGLERLGKPDAAFALVTLPFFLAHGKDLGCRPRLQAVQTSGAEDTFSLVSHRGAVASAASLAGWEITGRVGFAPDFVRGVVLGAWGKVPSSATISFTPRALSALRRAASGEKVAVILDAKEVAALDVLPFAPDLEIVTTSKPVPSSILCTMEGRIPQAKADALVSGLLGMHESVEGADALGVMQLLRFEEVDGEALGRAEKAYSGS